MWTHHKTLVRKLDGIVVRKEKIESEHCLYSRWQWTAEKEHLDLTRKLTILSKVMIESYIIRLLETVPKNLAKKQEQLKTDGINETILTLKSQNAWGIINLINPIFCTIFFILMNFHKPSISTALWIRCVFKIFTCRTKMISRN